MVPRAEPLHRCGLVTLLDDCISNLEGAPARASRLLAVFRLNHLNGQEAKAIRSRVFVCMVSKFQNHRVRGLGFQSLRGKTLAVRSLICRMVRV